MALPPLSDTAIKNFCANDKKFLGCIPQAYLLQRSFHPGYYILNLDKPTGPGTHWVLLYCYPTRSVYFDPYGEVPTGTAIKMCNEWKRPITEYNHNDYQSLGSNDCGYYCLFFAKGLNQGRSLSQLQRLFTTETTDIPSKHNPNDQYIEHLFKPYFHTQ